MESGMFGPLGTDKYREYCCDIRQSGQYLLEVINDILDMSKIEAGRIRLDAKQIELEPFLNDAMRVVSARADDKRLSLIARIRGGISLTADPRLLKQIVLNLLSNAVSLPRRRSYHHSRPGDQRRGEHCHCRYRHRHSERGARPARPAIRAGGKPAYQEPPGLGLGLAIAKSLTELHQGTIRIRSTTGRGTIVLLRLPSNRGSLQRDAVTEAAA